MSRQQTLLYVALAAIIVALVAWLWQHSPPAHAQDDSAMYSPDDTLAAINLASADTGVPRSRLYSIVSCETGGRFDPYAIGRLGELGVVQLKPDGELPRFYQYGYVDPFSPYQAVAFLAQRLTEGGSSAWSCR